MNEDLIEKAEEEIKIFERVSRTTGVELVEEVKRLRIQLTQQTEEVNAWLKETAEQLTDEAETFDAALWEKLGKQERTINPQHQLNTISL